MNTFRISLLAFRARGPKPWLIAVLLCLLLPQARGQTYHLEEYSIGSNPGEGRGGNFGLSSSLGQSVVGITGNDIYVWVSGFWSRNLVFSQPEMPALFITASNHLTILSWDATPAGLQLQETTSLDAPVWIDVVQKPVIMGSIAQITLASPGPQRFYRLRWPSL